MNLPLISEFESRFRDPVWVEVAADLCRRHSIPFKRLERAEHGENIVVLIDDAFVLKIYTPRRNGFQRERDALKFAGKITGLPIPKLLASGDAEGYKYIITDRFAGRMITRDEWLALGRSHQVRILSQLAVGLRQLHSHNAVEIRFDWSNFISLQIDSVIERQRAAGANPEWLESIPRFINDNIGLLPERMPGVLVHGDVHFGNIRVAEDEQGRPVIAGLFDFADSLKGFHEYEFVAPGVLMIQGQGELQREFFRAYGYADSDINEELRRRLMLLTILYECSSLKKYALRLKPEAVNYSLNELERAIWNFI